MRNKLVSLSTVSQQTYISINLAKCEEIINRLNLLKEYFERQKGMLQDTAVLIGSFSTKSELYDPVINLIKEIDESLIKTDQDLYLLNKLSQCREGKLTDGDLKRFELENQMKIVLEIINQVGTKGQELIGNIRFQVSLKKEYEELRKIIENKERIIIMQGVVQLMALINKGKIQRNELIRIIEFIDNFSGKKNSLKYYLVGQLGEAISKSNDQKLKDRLQGAIERISAKLDAQKLMFAVLREELVKELNGVSAVVQEASNLLNSLVNILFNLDSLENKEINPLILQINRVLLQDNQTLAQQEALLATSANVEARKDSISLQQLLKILDEKLQNQFKLLKEKREVLMVDYNVVASSNDDNWEEILG